MFQLFVISKRLTWSKRPYTFQMEKTGPYELHRSRRKNPDDDLSLHTWTLERRWLFTVTHASLNVKAEMSCRRPWIIFLRILTADVPSVTEFWFFNHIRSLHLLFIITNQMLWHHFCIFFFLCECNVHHLYYSQSLNRTVTTHYKHPHATGPKRINISDRQVVLLPNLSSHL